MNDTHHIQPTGFLRIKRILGDPKSNPPIPAIIPVGKTTWWNGVKSGKYPQPVKLGPRLTAWRAGDILELCERICRKGGVA